MGKDSRSPPTISRLGGEERHNSAFPTPSAKGTAGEYVTGKDLRSTWFGLRAEVVWEKKPAQLHGESPSYRRNAGTVSAI